MALIGMPEAARRLGVHPDAAKRTLVNAGVALVQINAKAYAVEEAAVARLIAEREARGIRGRGRPRKSVPGKDMTE